MADEIIDDSVKKQLNLILSGISGKAESIRQLVFQMHSLDAEDVAAIGGLNDAIAALAAQIGWSADLGNVKIDGRVYTLHGEDAEDWMMPPAYHKASEGAAHG